MTRRTRYLAAGGVGLILLVGAVWFLFFRDTAPPAASLEDAVASVTSTTAPASPAGESLDGSWTIDNTVGAGAIEDGSFVGYRVQEELANVGAKTAVGRTTGVSGTFTFTGSVLESAAIVADLTGLESDSSSRDNFLRNRSLETNTFPEATFTLTAPVDLGAVPGAGESFSVQAVGDLTVHGVTRSVTVPIQGQLVGDTVVVVGQIDVVFADYDIETPRAAVVLSIEDQGVMEFQLFLTRS